MQLHLLWPFKQNSGTCRTNECERLSSIYVISEQASFAFLPITSRSRVGQAGFAYSVMCDHT